MKKIEKITVGADALKSAHASKARQNKGITLIALIITILFSYDEMIRFSNSKGFLLVTI